MCRAESCAEQRAVPCLLPAARKRGLQELVTGFAMPAELRLREHPGALFHACGEQAWTLLEGIGGCLAKNTSGERPAEL